VSTPRNLHNVQQRTWRKWSAVARHTFNELYSSMKKNQILFLHPKQGALTRQKWQTVAWNAAWVAADAIREYERDNKAPRRALGDKVVDITKSGRAVREHKVVH